MMVLFVSRSEKQATRIVRRILDTFADRIGTDTWRTIITEDGLQTVHTLLRRNATKNTAVSCHWIRSRSRSDLLWTVGKRDAFNEQGVIPIGTTKKNISHYEWENNWQYMGIIQALAAVAALLHDWGKASALFQKKLRDNIPQPKFPPTADPLRHEWISCKILATVVAYAQAQDDDSKWLAVLGGDPFPEKKIISLLKTELPEKYGVLGKLPPVASLLVWLILSHHRLPNPSGMADKNWWKGYCGENSDSLQHILDRIRCNSKTEIPCWDYDNREHVDDMRTKRCFTFPHGLLGQDAAWLKQLRKWSCRLNEMLPQLKQLMEKKDSTSALRAVLLYTRLCLMLSDHYVSSQAPVNDGTPKEQADKTVLWANTWKRKKEEIYVYKQTLSDHVTAVCSQALRIAWELPAFSEQMERLQDVAFLRKKGPFRFQWQDKAVEAIRTFRRQKSIDTAFFVVNMASTGCGKTIANAKIMQALSEDGKSLRYILALGLRTLTLQTGDEYRQRIGMKKEDLAVLIGSAAIQELHDADIKQQNMSENILPQAMRTELQGETEELLSEDVEYIDLFDREQRQFLDIFFKNNPKKEKNLAFLYKPVLVATIDHMMGATETIRGGRYILPFLRLMSSDLVIDEIDDFGKTDLIAIARLIH